MKVHKRIPLDAFNKFEMQTFDEVSKRFGKKPSTEMVNNNRIDNTFWDIFDQLEGALSGIPQSSSFNGLKHILVEHLAEMKEIL